MHKLLITGAGKIGSLITFLLSHSNNYFIYLADIQENNPAISKLGEMPNFKYVHLDAKDSHAIADFVKTNQIEAIISSLPYYCNIPIAKIAAEMSRPHVPSLNWRNNPKGRLYRNVGLRPVLLVLLQII
jgi:saccharopine dehydrogenase-like NADP-dependent oxidoreductase